jgi:hypothetical protein
MVAFDDVFDDAFDDAYYLTAEDIDRALGGRGAQVRPVSTRRNWQLVRDEFRARGR